MDNRDLDAPLDGPHLELRVGGCDHRVSEDGEDDVLSLSLRQDLASIFDELPVHHRRQFPGRLMEPGEELRLMGRSVVLQVEDLRALDGLDALEGDPQGAQTEADEGETAQFLLRRGCRWQDYQDSLSDASRPTNISIRFLLKSPGQSVRMSVTYALANPFYSEAFCAESAGLWLSQVRA